MHQLSRRFELSLIGSPNLYLLVRAGFVNQGTSLNEWCIARGVNRQTAEKALKGMTRSGRALDLVQEMVVAACPESATK